MGRQHTTGPEQEADPPSWRGVGPFAYAAGVSEAVDGRARAPVPHRSGRLPGPPRAPAAVRGAGAARGRELLRLLEARDRGQPGALRPRGERARARAAPRPPLQQDGRRLARLRRGHRPRHRVRLPRRPQPQPDARGAALRPRQGAHRPLLEGGGGPREVGRGRGREGPPRAAALPGRGRGVRLGPRAPARRPPRRLGHLRDARPRLHPPPDVGRLASRAPSAGSSRRSPT